MDELLQLIGNQINYQDGYHLADLLKLGQQKSLHNQIVSQCSNPGAVRQRVNRVLRDPWNKIVSLHFRCYSQLSQNKFVDAFKIQAECADSFYEFIVKDKDTNWWLPAINVVVLQLRIASYRADEALEQQGHKEKHKVEAQDILKKFFQRMIIDRSALDCSKKMGCLFIIVHLFKIYFKINNLRLCSNLIASVNNANFPKFELFPKSQTVAYNYYVGRLKVFEEQYTEAETCLEYAFEHCHLDNVTNKRRILQFLVPVKLLLGKYPQEQLLKKYQLTQFSGLLDATRRGDLTQFNASLEANQDFFINKGIFLILEKLKTFVYRNLFRKAYCYCVATKEKNKNQLELKLLLASLRVHGIDMGIDELECILANLIFQGLIKGYIAHKKCMIVSKADPFPRVSSVQLR